jgi:3-oxoacyl-[acyl-carrier protein] reductase
MELELTGKHVLITGASKGIGQAVAKHFAKEGAHVHLVSRDRDALNRVADDIRQQYGVGAFVYAHDLSDSTQIAALAKAVPHIDVLVNNAGAIPGGSVAVVDEAKWRAAWDLKVFGYINMCRTFLEIFGQQGHGVIVNIIGIAGVANDYDYICGSAGNAALIAFTNALGSRSTDKGVRVIGLNPAATRTSRQETLLRSKAQAKFNDAERWEELLADLPFDRLAEPDEVADLAVFLASARASYLSGTVINLDGGNFYRKR